MKTKKCSYCGKRRPLSKFRKNKSRKDGLQYWCKICCIEYEKEYRRTHKTKANKYRRKYNSTLIGCLRRRLADIKSRCDNPNHYVYRDYGGRGIKCLFKSVDDFMNHILDDLKPDPRGFNVARINSDGNYEPGNVYLITNSNSQTKRGKRTGCTSRFKGVSWNIGVEKWRAGIRINGKGKHLGYFDDEIEAAYVYDAAAIESFGEFARTNEMMGLFDEVIG